LWSGRLASGSPIFSRTVPQLFYFSRSPQRLNLIAERFVRFYHDISEPPVDFHDPNDAPGFIRDLVMDDVFY
jgi:hypothetical protein